MLGNNSWSYHAGGVCNNFCDNDFKEQAMRTVGTEICSNIPAGAALINNQNSFKNEAEEKETNDLSFIGWPDLVTLEDADIMLRSFNSAVGCGDEDGDFSWYSSQCIDGSDTGMKSDFKYPFSESSSLKHMEERDGASTVVNTNYSTNESNYSSAISTAANGQMGNHKDQTETYNQSEANMKDHGYLQMDTPFSQPGMKLQSSNFTTLSSSHMEEFSTVSNGVGPMDSSLDICSEVPSLSIKDRRKNLDFTYLSNPNFEVNGANTKNQEIIDFSNVPQTSCLSSELETSPEASRLSQLQQVMHKLDTRTKLCLRDGLYRLAKSAELRHFSASEGSDESNDLMDMETKTNPIDRSIAHLLFHRSVVQSANSAPDGLSLQINTMVDGFIDTPPYLTE